MTNELKAGAVTAAFTFIGAFALGALGWVAEVAAWASSEGASDFPGYSALGYAVAAALVAAVTGLLNFLVRWAQGKGWVPGNGPVYGEVIDVTVVDDPEEFPPDYRD